MAPVATAGSAMVKSFSLRLLKISSFYFKKNLESLHIAMSRKRKLGILMMKVFHNDDLVEQILLHLPPIHVFRFKSVCKRWLKILSNPSFIRQHTVYFHHYNCISRFLPSIIKQDVKNPYKSEAVKAVFHLHEDRWRAPSVLPDLSFSFMDEWEKNSTFSISHSCNGLLLIYIRSLNQVKGDYCVCNHLTKEYVKLPSPSIITYHGTNYVVKSYGTNIVFDPSKSLQYKVVFIAVIQDGYCVIIVYSSETQSWGVPREFGFDLEAASFNEGILFNGALYWLPKVDGQGEYMHRYDIESEVNLQESLLPPRSPEWKYRSWHCLGRSRNHLYLIEECLSWDISLGCTYKCYDIQPDFSFFGKCYMVFRSKLSVPPPFRFGGFLPLCFQTEGDKEVLFYGWGDAIFSLDINSLSINNNEEATCVGSFSDLAQSSSSYERNTVEVWDVIPYTNTLCPLK